VSELRLSVVMPTFNRAHVLRRTLDAYLAQLDSARDELLVVDDGSTDDTPAVLHEYATSHANLLRTFRQHNAGPAAARNRALREARGAIVLFAGDDVLPDAGTVAAHLAAHDASANSAALGSIRWHASLTLSPLMRWLDQSGVQFAFDGLHDGQLLTPSHWYSSNLSIPRALLPAQPVFDERFRAACWEDTDLGLRLSRTGVTLRYVAAASAQHHHAMTLSSVCARAERVGYFGALLEHKHGLASAPRLLPLEWLKRAAAPLLRAIPLGPVQGLGFRWTLAWPDYRGRRRFQRDQRALHSAP
jgi:glycosyltransferase involved in cell wall biosynthesis